MRTVLFALFIGMLPLHFALCDTELFDSKTTQMLEEDGSLDHPRQTTFNGLVTSLAKGDVGDGEKFGVEYALRYFKPFTPKQIKAVLLALKSSGFRQQSRLKLPHALAFLLVGQKLDEDDLGSLKYFSENDPSVPLSRAIARIRLHHNRSEPQSIALLWELAKPYLNHPLDSTEPVDVDAMLASLDLLFSADHQRARTVLLQKAESVAAVHGLIWLVGNMYSTVVGTEVIRQMLGTLQRAQSPRLPEFINTLATKNPSELARVYDLIDNLVPCENLLAAIDRQQSPTFSTAIH